MIITFLSFGLGWLSGFGFGLTRRGKPSSPPEEVDEETMRRFERAMAGSSARDRDEGEVRPVIH